MALVPVRVSSPAAVDAADAESGDARAYTPAPLSVASSAGVLLTANVVSNGLGVIRAISVARLMAPVDYGIWSLV